MPTEEITQAPAESDLRVVPLARINVAQGHNPRAHFDGDQLEELAASIRLHGVLQPLLLTPDTEADGEFQLVDGERRYQAATLASLLEVPAFVRATSNGDALDMAMVTNLKRVDLNLIEQGQAFRRALDQGCTQAELAERLSIKPRRISETLRLLRLPPGVQAHVAAGKLAASTAKTFEHIAKASTTVAEVVADYVVAEELELSLLAQRPSDVVSKAVDGLAVTCVAASSWHSISIDDLELPDELIARAKELADGDTPSISFSREDVDAAGAYGCLLEFDGDESWQVSRFICDAEFLADRVSQILDRHAARVQQQQEEAEAAAAADGGGQVDPDDPAAVAEAELRAKAERAAERKALADDKVAARGANLALGRKAAERFHEPELTKPMAELLALSVLSRDTAQLAVRGLALTREDWQTEETTYVKSRKANKTTVTYLSAAEAEEALWAWFRRARTAKQVIGRVMQALVAAQFADQVVLAQSKQSTWTSPARFDPDDPTHRIDELLRRIAKPVLPSRLAGDDEQ